MTFDVLLLVVGCWLLVVVVGCWLGVLVFVVCCLVCFVFCFLFLVSPCCSPFSFLGFSAIKFFFFSNPFDCLAWCSASLVGTDDVLKLCTVYQR